MTKPLPQGWKWATVNEVSHVVLGQSPPGSSYNDAGHGSPFFQGKAEFGSFYPEVRKWTTDPKKQAAAGSILVSVRAPVGPTNIAPFDCAIGRGLAALHPLGGISTEYLLWAMRHTNSALTKQGTGSTFDAVTGAQLKTHRLPISPQAEQARIIAAIEERFSRIDATESAAQTALAKLDTLRRTVLTAAFSGRLVAQDSDDEPASILLERIATERPQRRTRHAAQSANQVSSPMTELLPSNWAISKVGDLCKVEYGKGLSKKQRVQTGAVEVYGSAGLSGYHNEALIDEPVVIVGRKGNAGMVWVTQGPSWPIDTTYFLRPPQGVSAKYLSLQLGHLDLVEKDSSTTIPSLRRPDLEATTIAMAPSSEQEQVIAVIEEHFSRIDAAKTSLDRCLQRCSLLRQAVLAAAFSGRLVTQDPNDEPASVLLERIAAEQPKHRTPRKSA